ncbi:hypothetical protein ABK040_013817 [Willaertia magna]
MSDNLFKLRAECKGHIDQVRGICSNPLVDGGIITCSLDNVVKTWSPIPNYKEQQDKLPEQMLDDEELLKAKKQSEYENILTLAGHEKFITSVDFLPTNNGQSGYAVSGSHDKSIIVWNLNDGSIFKRYVDAHSNAISCLKIDKYTNCILSGSWDKSARVWNLERDNPVVSLLGHNQNVLCVLGLSGNIITGSGDGSIKIWDNAGKEIKDIPAAHQSCVRSLCELPNIGFLSVSNDGVCKTWTLQGDCIHEFHAHNNLIYSVDIHPVTGEILTASEDKTVKVWKDGVLQQTIEHPGCVWQVVILPNGDIATACSDSIARVFTRKEDKVANPEIIQSFNDNIQNSKKKKSGVDPTKLPSDLVLNHTKGTTDGEIKLVNQDGVPHAYSWNAKEQKWDKIGEVVEGGAGVGKEFASGKTHHNGKMYDYVFDVELEHGGGLRNFKLPYNKGDNPFFAAQQFIWDNELSQYYLDQIARFIVDNSETNDMEDVPTEAMPSDPYTGGQRETFTAKRPTPRKETQTTNEPVFSTFAKEQVQYQKELEEREKQKNIKHFPANFKILDQANYDGILKKLTEFNTSIANTEESKSLALSDSEVQTLQTLCSLLKSAQGDKVTTNHISIVEKLLQWPSDKVFPAVDLFRLLILTTPAAIYYAEQYKNGSNILGKIITLCFGPSSTVAMKMLGLRAFVNMFFISQIRFVVVKHGSLILDNTLKSGESDNLNVRSAYALLLSNIATAFYTNTQSDPLKEKLLKAIIQYLPTETDHNIQYDLLVAAGTILTGVTESVKVIAKENQTTFVQKTASPTAKVAACAFQIVSLLSQ